MSDKSHITETITPADQAGVTEALKSVAATRLAVYPVGGGTALDFGAHPTRPGIHLSLAKLNRTIDYPAADLMITVEAGMTITSLQKRLAAQRQWLPVDVSQPDRATVGGAVAVNAAGPRQYSYGTLRDYVLGLTAVDGTGTPFSGGGRVLHNAAGYNICRLMAGSLGTLGIITQVTLMVRPLPGTSVLLLCDVPNFVVAERLLADLAGSVIQPAAIEFVAGRQREDEFALGPVLEGNVGRLYVGLEGSAAEVEGLVGQRRDRWTAAGATAPMLVPATRAEPLWRWLADFTAHLQINVLPSAVVETVKRILAHQPQCAIQAHAGNGVIRLRLPLPLRAGQDGTDVISALRTIAAAAAGKLIVLRRPDGAAVTIADAWGPPRPEFRVMQAIKERFDPHNILNPGRFVFD
jgi:glycolate oxidase FAD binding subunit